MRTRWVAGAAAAFAALVAGGCLERKETVVVGADGGVTIKIRYEGKEEELNTLDALPKEENGWTVSRGEHKDKEDKETHFLTAEQSFKPGAALPRSYAAEDDRDRALYTDFPTTLRIERRADGTYYHFARVYSPRRWAYVQFWEAQALDDDVKKLAEKKADELTREERVRLMKAFGDFEAMRQVELAQAAAAALGDALPQDRWLGARRAALDVYENLDYDALAAELETLDAEARDRRTEEEVTRLLERARGAMMEALNTGGCREDCAEMFARALKRATREYDITAQVGGHAFRIAVHMPGEIVAHNADKVDDDGEAIWEFTGEAFRDRSYELRVTSRVASE